MDQIGTGSKGNCLYCGGEHVIKDGWQAGKQRYRCRDCDSAIGEEQTPYRAHFDEGIKRVARSVESVVNRHDAVVDWQSNLEVLREMRRDIKRELRPTDDYTEEQLEELANRIVDLARRRSGR